MVQQLTTSATEVHLWFLDLQQPLDVDMSILSDDEISRLNTFRVSEQKDTYLKCRYVLRQLLALYINKPPSSISLSYNSFGKPDLTYNPSHISFNISHCKHSAVIGITKGSIGVDIECKTGQSLIEASSLFLNDEEMEALKFTPDPERALLHLWTQKEAILKAEGTGFSSSPHAITGYVTSSVQLQNAEVNHYHLNSFMRGDSIVSICTSTSVNIKQLDFSYELLKHNALTSTING
ncbi:4'-phosphopantetheinyl transferase family protein [Fictibacillus norfolkensis]|uniref:4'-phosphopantetheinyl transferase superfamily protein n=1 Tax=Fictibacillus norfolkensis TaxID=2762233 RepID=A0ABR8SHW6_9BACL|nr:4'-phosphopantetheinyl transferase superfamily protein [Fictibacillus norfolkensis]MBD7963030.1 4'-phosphopantetheinyl transferase superfamily protein [Fictibacillus norfolkensis]